MLARLIKDTSLYTLSSFFSRGIGIILLPIMTRLLSPEQYGVIELVVALGALVNIIVTLEISQGLARYWPDTKDMASRQEYAATTLIFTLLGCALFVVVGLTFAVDLSNVLFETDQWADAMYIAVPSIAAAALFYLFQNQFRFELRAREFVLVSISHAMLTGCLTVTFVAFSNLGVTGVFLGQLLASLLVAPVAFRLLKESYRGRFEWGKFKNMLRFSLPLVPSGIAVVVFLYVDRLVISRSLSLDDVGVFGVGQRVASVVALLMVGLQGALTPLIYHHYKEEKTRQQLADILRLTSAILLMLVLGMGIFGREIVLIVAPERFIDAASVLFPLGLAAIFAGLYVFAPGLVLEKKTGVLSLINIAAAFCNLLLALVLTPRFGILGTSVGTLTASVLLFGLQMKLNQKFFKVPYPWPRLATALLVCCGFVGVGMMVGTMVASFWGAVILKGLVFTGASTLISLILLNAGESQLLVRGLALK